MMRKTLLMILLSISLCVTAQISNSDNNSKLDVMIRNSIESYIKHVDECWEARGWTKPNEYYVCKMGLTISFIRNDSIRSIPRVNYFSIDNLEDSRWLKKKLKDGFCALLIETQLNKDTIIIAVSNCYINKTKKYPSAQILDNGIYTYQYSEAKDDWILVKTQIGELKRFL